jgi:preprotein translocase subunit SecB
MSDPASSSPPAGSAASGGNFVPMPSPSQPTVQTVAQYLKDLSFENPRPFSRAKQGAPDPAFDIVVGVHSRRAEDGHWMVEFSMRAEAQAEQKTLFLAELIYVGCYAIENVPEDQVEPLLHLQCAPLLFPYARQIMDDAVQKGGYPPLHFHVYTADYLSLFQSHLERKRREAEAAAQQAAPSETAKA